MALLRAWKRERGLLALTLARPDAIVFGTINGEHVSPEKLTRNFGQALARCRKVYPDLPVITAHGLRHTHVSVLLSGGTPVKTVSARIGHSTPMVTMSVYAHLLDGDDEAAAGSFAALVAAAGMKYQRSITARLTAWLIRQVMHDDLRKHRWA